MDTEETSFKDSANSIVAKKSADKEEGNEYDIYAAWAARPEETTSLLRTVSDPEEDPRVLIAKSTGFWGRRGARVLEVARSFVGRRRVYKGAGFYFNLIRIFLLGAVGHFMYFYLSPAIVILLASFKADFAHAGVVFSETLRSCSYDLWGYVGAMGTPGTEEVAKTVTLLVMLLWFVLALYTASQIRTSSRVDMFGGGRPVSAADKTSRFIETNQLALLATTKTWKPGDTIEHASIPLGYSALFHRYFMAHEEDHSMLIAPPGTGKTTRVIYPFVHAIICAEKDSAIIFDPKGEIFNNTHYLAEAAGAKVIVHDYSNWRRSDPYNPLSLIIDIYQLYMGTYHQYLRMAAEKKLDGDEEACKKYLLRARNAKIDALSTADKYAKELAASMFPDSPNPDANFWQASAREFTRAVALLVATYTEDDWVGPKSKRPATPLPEQRTLMTMRHLLDVKGKQIKKLVDAKDGGRGKVAVNTSELEEIMDGLDPEHPARRAFVQAKISDERLRSSIMSTFLSELGNIVDEESNMVSYRTDYKLEDIGTKKTIVYLVAPQQNPSKAVFLPIYVTQAYQALCDLANRTPGGKTPMNVHFVMEELGSIKKINKLENMITAGRGMGIRVHAVVQSPSQWDLVYGEKPAEVIKDAINITNWVSCDKAEAARALSDAIGRHNVESISTSSSTPTMSILPSSSSTSRRVEERPVVAPEKIQSWDPLWGAFVERSRLSANKLANKLIFHRHETIVALYPTVAPQYQPSMAAFGIADRKHAAKLTASSIAIDKSPARILAPAWEASPLTEKQKEEVLKATRQGAPDSKTMEKFKRMLAEEKAKRDSVGLEEGFRRHARRCALSEDLGDVLRGLGDSCEIGGVVSGLCKLQGEKLDSNARNEKLVVRQIEMLCGLEKPYSCDTEEYLEKKRVLKRAWLSEYGEAIEQRLVFGNTAPNEGKEENESVKR